jgi:hypothetical protein
MGSKVAKAGGPLFGGGRVDRTDRTGCAIDNAHTPFACFYDGLAGVAVKNAAAFGPESTLGAGKNGFTLHRIKSPLMYRIS